MTPPTDNEHRRMSDQNVPMDVATQAVRLAELSSQQHALADRVATDGQATRDSLSSIQSDIKLVVSKFAEIVSLEHHHNANSVAIRTLNNQLENMGTRLDRWMETVERDYDRKWDEAIRNRDEWRAKHEAENRKTESTIIRWGGIALGVSLLAGTVVAMFQWNLALRFGYVEERQTSQAAVGTQNRGLIEGLQEGQSEIKLQLAKEKRDAAAAASNNP